MTGETVIGLGQFRFTEEEFKKYFLDESFIYTPELYIDIMGYKSSEYNDVTESDKPFLRVIKQDNYNTQLREEVKKVHNKNTKGK